MSSKKPEIALAKHDPIELRNWAFLSLAQLNKKVGAIKERFKNDPEIIERIQVIEESIDSAIIASIVNSVSVNSIFDLVKVIDHLSYYTEAQKSDFLIALDSFIV